MNGEKKLFKTEMITGRNQSPVWNYSQQHTFDSVTEMDIGYLVDTKVYSNRFIVYI